MIKKIISGGQIGADQAALDIALKLGIPHGGWIQKGRKTQSGLLPDKYRLTEMSTPSYVARIEQNIIDSDGTLILSHGKLTGSADYNRQMALKHQRHLLHVDLSQTLPEEAAGLVHSWTELHHIEALNVAGSRTSEDPMIYKATMDLLERLLHLSRGPGKLFTLNTATKSDAETGPLHPAALPETMNEAVDQIISQMPLKVRSTVAKLDRDNLGSLTVTLGLQLKKMLVQKDENKKLLESCRTAAGKEDLNVGEAAYIITINVWEKLRQTHRLRIVK